MKLLSLFISLAIIFALVAQICAADEAALKEKRVDPKQLQGTIRAKRNTLPGGGSLYILDGVSVIGDTIDLNALQNTLSYLVNDVAGILTQLSASANRVAALKEQLLSAVGDAKANIEAQLQAAVAFLNALFAELLDKLKGLIETGIETIKTLVQGNLANLSDEMITLLNKQLSVVSGNLAGVLDGNILDLINKISGLNVVQEVLLALAKNVNDLLTQVADTVKLLTAGEQTDAIATTLQQQLSHITALSSQLNALVGLVHEIAAVEANIEAIKLDLAAAAVAGIRDKILLALNQQETVLAGLIAKLEKLIDSIFNYNSIGIFADTFDLLTGGLEDTAVQPYAGDVNPFGNLVIAVGITGDHASNLGGNTVTLINVANVNIYSK